MTQQNILLKIIVFVIQEEEKRLTPNEVGPGCLVDNIFLILLVARQLRTVLYLNIILSFFILFT